MVLCDKSLLVHSKQISFFYHAAIPIAILQYPFYNLGVEALNYGAIGTILGHELTHGFDDSGRMFDKMGNMRQWWTNATIIEYINRTECFIDQYSKYHLEDIDEFVSKFLGDINLREIRKMSKRQKNPTLKKN